MTNCRDCHVQGGQHGHEKGKCTRRLRQHNNGIHNGMQDARNRGCPEQIDGHKWHRICECVQEADGDQRQNVLQIVAMGTVRNQMDM